MFDSVVIKLGHDACLRHCLDSVVSGERSKATMALLFCVGFSLLSNFVKILWS
jgi:hypothetical protein